MKKLERVEILNLSFDVLKLDDLNNIILERIREQKKIFIANHNLHSAFLFNYDEDFKKAYELAEYIHADGMSLILWARLMGYRVKNKNRLTSLDFYPPLFRALDEMGARIFFLGAKSEVVLKAVTHLSSKYPRIHFSGHTGFFDLKSQYEEDVLELIRSDRPNLLMIGMGMPRQEKWIFDNFEDLPNAVILPCGAFFDYIVGAVRTPPRWLSLFCLEWFFRFLFEPQRLFKRYFIEPFYLLPIFMRDVLKKIHKY